jgi:hypothetical protein
LTFVSRKLVAFLSAALSCCCVTGETGAWPNTDFVSCLVSCALLGPVSKQATPKDAAHTIENLFMFTALVVLIIVDVNRHMAAGALQTCARLGSFDKEKTPNC